MRYYILYIILHGELDYNKVRQCTRFTIWNGSSKCTQCIYSKFCSTIVAVYRCNFSVCNTWWILILGYSTIHRSSWQILILCEVHIIGDLAWWWIGHCSQYLRPWFSMRGCYTDSKRRQFKSTFSCESNEWHWKNIRKKSRNWSISVKPYLNIYWSDLWLRI